MRACFLAANELVGRGAGSGVVVEVGGARAAAGDAVDDGLRRRDETAVMKPSTAGLADEVEEGGEEGAGGARAARRRSVEGDVDFGGESAEGAGFGCAVVEGQ